MPNIRSNQLQKGDVVRLLPETGDPFPDLCVEKIDGDKVTFFGVYIRADEVGEQIIPMIGTNSFRAPLHDGHKYRLMRRNDRAPEGKDYSPAFLFLSEHMYKVLTPKQWAELFGVVILDRDGWRRGDFDKPINLQDFWRCLNNSTIAPA